MPRPNERLIRLTVVELPNGTVHEFQHLGGAVYMRVLYWTQEQFDDMLAEMKAAGATVSRRRAYRTPAVTTPMPPIVGICAD